MIINILCAFIGFIVVYMLRLKYLINKLEIDKPSYMDVSISITNESENLRKYTREIGRSINMQGINREILKLVDDQFLYSCRLLDINELIESETLEYYVNYLKMLILTGVKEEVDFSFSELKRLKINQENIG